MNQNISYGCHHMPGKDRDRKREFDWEQQAKQDRQQKDRQEIGSKECVTFFAGQQSVKNTEEMDKRKFSLSFLQTFIDHVLQFLDQ